MYCIYQITNKINGKTYIGQHKYKVLNDSYMGSGKIIKSAQAKYGLENFEKKILVFNITSRAFINTLEKEYISFYRSIGKAEYNIADGGYGGCGKHSEETRKKMSQNNSMHKKEYRDKVSKALKGRVFTKEWKDKISTAVKGRTSPRKGKHLSEETKKKLSESVKRYWENRRIKDE